MGHFIKTAVIAGAVALVMGGTGAYAADALITSSDIQDETITTHDVKDGSLGERDLNAYTQGLYAKQADLAQAVTKQDDLAQAVTNLQNQVTDLQAELAGLEAPNAFTVDNGEGAIKSAHDAVITEPEGSLTGASLSKSGLNLAYHGGKVSFTYNLANGAKQGWGAPRAVVEIDGKWYSTVGNVTANYGTKNADGSWTQNAVPVFGNEETPAPAGTITSVAVVYDNLPQPGSVFVHNLAVEGNVLSFK